MKHDSYQRFLKSDIFAKCVKKEAGGKELSQLDIKTGRIKKSSHTFFNWTHSSSFKGSSFKGSNPVSSNRHKRLSLSVRPRSLNLETGSESTPSVGSKTTSVSLSSSHRDLSPSSYERKVVCLKEDNLRQLPGSPTTLLSCFNTSPIQSSVNDDHSDRMHQSSVDDDHSDRVHQSTVDDDHSDRVYPSPPPVNLVRRNLLSNPAPLCSTKYDFFSTTQSDSRYQESNLEKAEDDLLSRYRKSNLEKAEDDLLSSIISASQRAPKINTDRLPDFDSPRDLYRFLSQPDLSPAFMDTTTSDEPSNEKRMGAYLSPSVGDVPKECLGIEGEVIRKTKKRGHRLHPPPIPSGKSRPLAPLPSSSSGSSSSGAGRTPLKRITTNNFDPYSSILV